MKRQFLIAILVLAAGLDAVALAGATPAAKTAPRAQLRDFICQTALNPPARAVSVTAVMRPLSGTRKLQLEVQLLSRAAGSSSWTTVPGQHLGVWVSPTNPPTLGQRPGDVWNVPIAVADLAAPATYRFSVSFRWIGAHNAVLGTASRSTTNCHQPELRPDLTVNSFVVRPDLSNSSLEDFSAVIGDIGATGAGPFTVQWSYMHAQLGRTRDQTVGHIDAHSTKVVSFAGVTCDPSTPVTVTVDPTDSVKVYSRAQAKLTLTCPPLQVPAAAADRSHAILS